MGKQGRECFSNEKSVCMEGALAMGIGQAGVLVYLTMEKWSPGISMEFESSISSNGFAWGQRRGYTDFILAF